jgi:hypothetical protein
VAGLSSTERTILYFLQADATDFGKIFHWDPGWIARKLEFSDSVFSDAVRRLAARGLICFFEYEGQLTDISLIKAPSERCPGF